MSKSDKFHQWAKVELSKINPHEEGKISSGVGSKILGCDRSEFYRLIREQGFAVIDYTETEFEEEARTSRHLGDKLASL